MFERCKFAASLATLATEHFFSRGHACLIEIDAQRRKSIRKRGSSKCRIFNDEMTYFQRYDFGVCCE
jgi:hypothetical protein